VLALEQEAVLRGRNEFLRGAAIAAQVRLVVARHRDEGGMMKVVVPERVDPILRDELHFLRLVLADDDDGSPGGGAASLRRDVRDHMS
jgi:hypothetical protein